MNKIKQYPLYFILMLSDLISNFGDTLFYLALMNYVLNFPQANVAIAIVTVSEMLPKFLPFLTGAYADRTHNKLGMILMTLNLRIVLYLIVGILMGFSPALWGVITIEGLNFLADISGQYESSLFIPISLPLVSNEDREQLLALRQTAFQLSGILFQVVSATLLLWFSYQHLAFLNAGTFLVAALIFMRVRAKLTNPTIASPSSEMAAASKSNLFMQFHSIFVTLKAYPSLLLALTIAPFLNAIFSAITPISLLLISSDAHFLLGTESFTIVAFSLVMTFSGIIGSILAMTVLKNVSLSVTMKASAISPILIYGAYLTHNIWLVLLSLSIAIALTSTLSPKFSAIIFNELPQESLATVVGSLNTIMQSGMVMLSLLTSGLIVILPIDHVILIFLGLGLIVAIGSFYYAYRKGV